MSGEMDCKIREMTIDDYDEVTALWRDTEGIGLGSSDTRESVASYLERNRSLSIVAQVGNEIVGAALCGHDGRRGYLHHLAVEKSQRGKGIGLALVNACIEALDKIGIRKCNVFLFSDNQNAEDFWRHNGWNFRDDLTVMQKVIRE